MRKLITALLLATGVASVAQTNLPPVPTDSVVYRINLSLGLAIGGAAICGGTALFVQSVKDNSDHPDQVDTRAAAYGYILGGGMLVCSFAVGLNANWYKAKAGRTLRNVRRP